MGKPTQHDVLRHAHSTANRSSDVMDGHSPVLRAGGTPERWRKPVSSAWAYRSFTVVSAIHLRVLIRSCPFLLISHIPQ